MERQVLEIVEKQGFQHSTGLRALTQMRGQPILLDRGLPGSSCWLCHLLCLAVDPIRPGFQTQTGIILPSCAEFLGLAAGSVRDHSGGLLQIFSAS
ncbi:hypothetical protein ACFOYU_04790 [Microvirga sp. GCM10011540]|uniref:hypothetical protein n=1 Tax=Microvirga sp. GCM10011540 TaxID=3317338 RepID=UPI00361CFEC3